ncbi:MAG: amidase [Peptococcaceae bacterium]|jgi:Asp-tRNA(Asn)/Glu-tRNA(Gln) amidotransferase A subunit family amidase|nr:amidase [Peptococcaceae bacterium]MDH7525700.1 amidase [Peptococcaceae bacterium]
MMKDYPETLLEVTTALRSGKIDLQDYINSICDRIDERDSRIQALVPETGRRERLLWEAAELEKKYPLTGNRPPLFGVLVGIKDIFRVDGFPTRAGSKLPAHLFDGAQARCVTRLREAGALILGKTVTTEFAYFAPGPTRNPHNLAHTPGGSSSGSAAAVAAGFCPLAVGTQTVGSVIRPAAFCGITGYKPSYDRISTEGLLYYSRSLDHVGLFTRDAAGMLLAAAVVCRDWEQDRAAANMTLPVLGVPEGPYLKQAPAGTLAAFEEYLLRLVEAGCTVKRIPALENIEEINRRHNRLGAAEMAREHEKLFAEYEGLYRERTADLIREGKEVSAEEVEEGKKSRGLLRTELEGLMDENGLDLWVSPPSTGEAPAGIESTGNPIMNLPWTHAGLPTVTLPAGRGKKGLPLGLQFSARFMADEMLLAWAVKLEELLAYDKQTP